MSELLDRCSARELAEWEAFFALEVEEARLAEARASGRLTSEDEIMTAFRRLRGDAS